MSEPQEGFDPIYRDLIWKLHQAARDRNTARSDELFQLIEALHREYPDDAERCEKGET
jgi:hypothetical protein